jgi:hypothetical protein
MGSLYGVTLVQQMTYRGDATEEWSNTWHFRDPPPSSSAAWETAVTALAQLVKTVIPDTGKIIRAYGYDDDSDKPVSVYTKDWLLEGSPIVGTYNPLGSDFPLAGDQAYFIWWKLDKRNSRGKWIYLRKYLHDGYCDFTDPDRPAVDYKAQCELLAGWMHNVGTPFAGGVRSRTDPAPILEHGVSEFITTRTLKRRGKRPIPKA